MKGYLVLSTGEIFEGVWNGSAQEAYGEVVFYTGMSGYQEVLTDPANKGQIVVFTYPMIGNCGMNDVNNESGSIQVEAIITNSCSKEAFHYEATSTVQSRFVEENVPLLSGFDTRTIVKRIREQGDMAAIVTTDLKSVDFSKQQKLEERELVQEVSTREIKSFGEGKHHVVIIDFGTKKSLIDTLKVLDCKVTVVPYETSFEEITSLQPDGIVLSNGPGTPKLLASELKKIKQLAITFPTLALSLGHQLLALAFGGDVEKLSFGHRGGNQPIIDLSTNKVYMTSQNHSYSVKEESLAGTGFSVRYKNINDRSVEGMVHDVYPILSVQFHPEAHPGAEDSGEIFTLFIQQMRSKRREKVYA